MAQTKLNTLTIHAAHDLLLRREVSSVELTRAILDEIDEVLEENAEEFVRSYVQKGGE